MLRLLETARVPRGHDPRKGTAGFWGFNEAAQEPSRACGWWRQRPELAKQARGLFTMMLTGRVCGSRRKVDAWTLKAP